MPFTGVQEVLLFPDWMRTHMKNRYSILPNDFLQLLTKLCFSLKLLTALIGFRIFCIYLTLHISYKCFLDMRFFPFFYINRSNWYNFMKSLLLYSGEVLICSSFSCVFLVRSCVDLVSVQCCLGSVPSFSISGKRLAGLALFLL